MKNILGLDLGTNSIGWAWIQSKVPQQTDDCPSSSEYLMPDCATIRMAGSRVLPMDGKMLSGFESGLAVSKTKERTTYRMARRVNERFQLRRERLNRVLRILGFLPAHYAACLDRYGKIDEEKNVTIPWEPTADGKRKFLFYASFLEMKERFHEHHPNLEKIPLDWTLYYLRTKALQQAITKEELAWVLHSFNQKRGYNQSRDEVKDEDASQKEEYVKVKVVSVVDSGEKKKGKPSYIVTTESNLQFTTENAAAPSWLDKEREFIVTTKLNPTGLPKMNQEGRIDCTVRIPKEEDWELKKKRTEALIADSHMTVGEYIFHSLLDNPDAKIKGAKVGTIDRHFYKEELIAILKKQAAFHPELKNAERYAECVSALYASNEMHRNILSAWDMPRLIVNDIIFYQRPLKSKKSDIAECPFESRYFMDKEKKLQKQGIKCIPTSHPHFQEYRIWQFLSNLRVLRREVRENGRYMTDVDVSAHYLTDKVKVELYEWLAGKANVKQKELLSKLRMSEKEFRWNYVEDNIYPCGETRSLLSTRLKKAKLPISLLDSPSSDGSHTFEFELWHILYSVSDLAELRKALRRFARKHDFTAEQQEAFVETFVKCPPFKKDYGAYSDKALVKLLSLMRIGKYWNADRIDANTRRRIACLLDGEACDSISLRTREKVAERGLQQSIEQFQGLPQSLACYVIYDRHAEASEVVRWESPADLQQFTRQFKQNSLRNPIVEQVVLETLRVVHELWEEIQKDGGTIDEIHLEMGRDLKNTAEQRARIMRRNRENEMTNFRIKLLLQELHDCQPDIEGIRPYSPSQQELLRLYEETVWESESGKSGGKEASKDIPDDIKKIRDLLSKPSDKPIPQSAIQRYRLWLDQKYLSPYTGRPIPLARLFTADYEIEHIIPRSIFFDDSYANKVICESAVNKLKNNRLGMQFIREMDGRVETVKLGEGRETSILSVDGYVDLVNDLFRNNPRKRNNLLAEEITEDFCHRQLNDTRYIARYIKGILSNIVRQRAADGTLEQEATSKNLIVCTGQITDRVKQDWGLNDVWNHIITPRFERLNRMTGSNDYGEWCCKEGKRYFQTRVPLHLQIGFNKKRIDHRHHAMDAIAIACVNRNVVNYLNNAAAHATDRMDLRMRICRPSGNGQTKREIRSPWKNFAHDAECALQAITVSFKQNVRIITKATNTYEGYDASGKKVRRCQTSLDHYSIRKPLHKDTVYGEVVLPVVNQVPLKKALLRVNRIVNGKLRKKIQEMQSSGLTDKQIVDFFMKTCADSPEWNSINFKKIEVRAYSNEEGQTRMAAIRTAIDESFSEKVIGSITDVSIQRILLNHLRECNGDSEEAFSPEGIETMNRNIVRLNGGKPHLPIYKVRLGEAMGKKFAVGQRGNKGKKFVITAKNTNLFFAVYANDEGKRSFETIDLHCALEMQKQGKDVAPSINEKGDKLLFVLSPNDLVYVPSESELQHDIDSEDLKLDHVFKVVSCQDTRIYFIPNSVASPIAPGFEFKALNKVETVSNDGIYKQGSEMISIKNICLPIKTDRLGRFHLVKI